ncbi:pantothenate kinase [Leptodesmis sichuanensis]|uniref:pantothenate kinase n=1 Tax=Leptodesmis sichuanensis TaxID=2906798 RepID=UPI001F18A13D|nr:pantothenate kinase [Leptodesmis sichuanensis]
MALMESWLALAIGNSHLHWGLFIGDRLHHTWDTPHLSPDQVHYLISHHFDFTLFPSSPHPPPPNPHPLISNPPLHIASVVPTQTQLWTTYPQAHLLQLTDVPLQGMYPTFGLDRALTLWAAILAIGSPVLVIDAGTALTFTAADENHHLLGGAILPGLRLQLAALSQNTAALPHSPLPTSHSPLPPHWSLTTPEAIASGILHTLLAGIRDFLNHWWKRYPAGQVMMTGGDSDRFYHYLITEQPILAQRLHCDRTLIFKGMQAVRAQRN